MTMVTDTTRETLERPDGFLLEQLLTGRAIENQEARGQAELAEATVLPADMQGERAAFEALGFWFGAQSDALFVAATLPTG